MLQQNELTSEPSPFGGSRIGSSRNWGRMSYSKALSAEAQRTGAGIVGLILETVGKCPGEIVPEPAPPPGLEGAPFWLGSRNSGGVRSHFPCPASLLHAVHGRRAAGLPTSPLHHGLWWPQKKKYSLSFSTRDEGAIDHG